jgi:hypothetical protein
MPFTAGLNTTVFVQGVKERLKKTLLEFPLLVILLFTFFRI